MLLFTNVSFFDSDIMRPLLSLFCLLILSQSLSAQETRHWSEVPIHAGADLSHFSNLFQSAHTETLGITILGDSQETVIGGFGRDYVPALSQEFFRTFQNVPKTAFSPSSNFTGGFLLSGLNANSVSTLFHSDLPGTSISEYDNSRADLGVLAQLSTDNANAPNATFLEADFFNGNEVSVELLLKSKPGSSEVSWRVNTNESNTKTYFGGIDIATGTTNLGLDRPAVEFVNVNLGTFSIDPDQAIQVIARGNSLDSTATIAGVRFVNESDSSGVAIQSISRGGLRTLQFLDVWGESEDAFNAYVEDDIVAISYGANDGGSNGGSRTAAQFRIDMLELIDELSLIHI